MVATKFPFLQSPCFLPSPSLLDHWATEIAQLRGRTRLVVNESLSLVLEEARVNNDRNMGIEAAIEWGKDFEFSQALLDRDEQALRAAGNDSSVLCRRYQLDRAESRISRERIMRVLPDELVDTIVNGRLDRQRAIDIAELGMVVDYEAGFVPNCKLPKLRRKYLLAHGALHKLIEAQVLNKTAVILPLDLVKQWPAVHFSCLSWTAKKGKAFGRLIADTSNNDPGSSVVNATTVAGEEAIRRRYGDIQHPTILDVISAVLLLEVREGSRDKLILWKQDLAGAYTLLNLAPDDTKVFCFELLGNKALMFIAGMFGWTSTPFAFQVITRLLLAATSVLILGLLYIYVDDYMGVTTIDSVAHDRRVARSLAQDLLGPDSVADKDEEGRRLEMLGWVLDLNLWSVSISRENVLKAIYGFTNTSLDSPVPLKQLQKIASWSSRYAFLYAPMASFTVSLHKLAASSEALGRPQRLSKEGIEDVLMWRAWLCLVAVHEDGFARSLVSFRVTKSSVRVEYDASLVGVGIIISVLHSDEWRELCHGGASFPFDVGMDSSYQNTCEYCAVLLALFWLFSHGYRHVGVDIYGDNSSSLQWIKQSRARSLLARRPSLGFHLLLAISNNTVNLTVHVPGVKNVQCDGLSRGLTSIEVGLDPRLNVNFYTGCPALAYLKLCDPTPEGAESIPDITDLMSSLHSQLAEVL